MTDVIIHNYPELSWSVYVCFCACDNYILSNVTYRHARTSRYLGQSDISIFSLTKKKVTVGSKSRLYVTLNSLSILTFYALTPMNW